VEEIVDRGAVQDWGEAPESGIFYGRYRRTSYAKQWIVKDSCRLVTLLGMGGIGKTALTVKFAESIQDQFQYVIWRTLALCPTS
jgi:predicted ribonuclease YlaK